MYGNPYGGLSPTSYCSTAPPTVTILAPNFKNAYAHQFTAGYSRQIARDLALVVDGVSKRFMIPHERRHTIKERVLHPLSRPTAERLDALDDVSFAVERGEFFGIVGRNGSGKSTLLKCLAGVYRVDHGAIYVDGRLATFIELGVGFNPDMAARYNVYMNAIMLGLDPSAARERFESVIGTTVERVSRRWRRFRVFGEIVDLYWRRHDDQLALELEASWRELRSQIAFPLLCAYELAPGEDAGAIFACHDTVVSA